MTDDEQRFESPDNILSGTEIEGDVPAAEVQARLLVSLAREGIEANNRGDFRAFVDSSFTAANFVSGLSRDGLTAVLLTLVAAAARAEVKAEANDGR